MPSLLVILGDQLFQRDLLPETDAIFMAEDWELCTRHRHHSHKLVLFLTAMRRWADTQPRRVHYHALDAEEDPQAGPSYISRLLRCIDKHGYDELHVFRPADRFMLPRLQKLARKHDVKLHIHRNPGFLTSPEEFSEWADGHRLHMADFYRHQRQQLGLLLTQAGGPVGGKWSFDTENREALPKDIEIPSLPDTAHHPTVATVQNIVAEHFPDHPGDPHDFWMPSSRREALAWLRRFIEERLPRFGAYQDALSRRDDTLFHSVLSPLINCGLLTPDEVVERVAQAWHDDHAPLAAVEGFVRQVIGWREFIHGIDHLHGRDQARRNHFRHHRTMAESWWTGETGIPPLDAMIEKTERIGYSHHIERLMVAGNLMLLAEIRPEEAYRWFMERHVDSADWVMGPNVYGMALFSDGGLFATKPYCAGSNYLRKMGDDAKGPWCDIVDGLYWRFILAHATEFAGNPRMVQMVRTGERMGSARKERILAAAETWLAEHTTS